MTTQLHPEMEILATAKRAFNAATTLEESRAAFTTTWPRPRCPIHRACGSRISSFQVLSPGSASR